jgi:hypothetical protein
MADIYTRHRPRRRTSCGSSGESEPATLKINMQFEEAVRRAMHAPIPPGGVPEREKRKRGPNKVPNK